MSDRKDVFGHYVTKNHVGDLFVIVNLKVSGVTFSNGRRSRQTILRQIHFRDEPYDSIDEDRCIDLVPVIFDGEKAVEVWVDSGEAREQIGFVPKNEAAYFYDHLPNLYKTHSFAVYGGREGRSYGASFTAVFHAVESELEPVVSSSAPAPKTAPVPKPAADISKLYYCPQCDSFFCLEKSAVFASRCQCSGVLQKTDIDAQQYASMTRSQQAKATRNYRKYGHSQASAAPSFSFRSFLSVAFRVLVLVAAVFYLLALFR